MNTKNWLFAVGLAALLASNGMASPFDEFKSRAQQNLLKPFAKDLGAILGGFGFHSGRALGFPGFDVAAIGSFQFRPNQDNLILKNANVKAFGLPVIQAAVGLPFKVDLAAQGFSYSGASILGAGVRYGIIRSGLVPAVPDLSVSAFYNNLSHDVLKARHYSLNVAASFNIPFIRPYLGLGYDNTKVEAKQALVPGVSGLSATASGTRVSAGIHLSLLPLTHIFAGYTLANGVSGAHAGLGVRF